ncbi:MAG: hypothetical protein ACJ0UT_01860 [Candidatus Latescibacterota bacterium]
MPWEKRTRGGKYYTRSRRHRGKIIRQYFGHGDKGRKAALEDANKRAHRANRTKARRQQQVEYENTLNQPGSAHSKPSATKSRTPFYRPLATMRIKDPSGGKNEVIIKPNQPRPEPAELENLLARAQAGDEQALQTMQSTIPHLDTVIAESYDDADAERVEATLIGRRGQDLLEAANIRTRLRQRIGELAAGDKDNDKPLIRIVAHRVAICELQMHVADLMTMHVGEDPASASIAHRYQEKANRMFLRACKTLGQIKRLLR